VQWGYMLVPCIGFSNIIVTRIVEDLIALSESIETVRQGCSLISQYLWNVTSKEEPCS
jgi:hypothetical protein